LSGTLIADEEKTITMTLSDPSALAVGAYAGTVVATYNLISAMEKYKSQAKLIFLSSNY